MKQRINRFEKIVKELEQASEILSKVRQSIENELERLEQRERKRPSGATESLPSDNELKDEYNSLVTQYANERPRVAQEFIVHHSARYLQAFFQINNLAIDYKKQSKEEMTRMLDRFLAESCTIRGIRKEV